jgi:hypothetical protein
MVNIKLKVIWDATPCSMVRAFRKEMMSTSTVLHPKRP